MKYKKFIFDIFSNPDGLTYSSKRAGGFISLAATIAFGALKFTEPMVVMAGLVVAFFGLSSIDYKEFMKSAPTEGANDNAPINP